MTNGELPHSEQLNPTTMVEDWFEAMSEDGEVKSIDRRDLAAFLKKMGAESIDDIPLKMGEEIIDYRSGDNVPPYETAYRIDDKEFMMLFIWGNKYTVFKSWLEEWIADYETKIGDLPKMGDSGRKDKGMLQFFAQLTELAIGAISHEKFKDYTEARLFNGRCWQEGRKRDRKRIKVPTSKEPILPASVPPGFGKDLFEFLIAK